MKKTNHLLSPVIKFQNADIHKRLIFNEIESKTGAIYRWINLINGKSYIGSSVFLKRRVQTYYRISYLVKNNSKINNALLKYSHKSFSFEVLEYIDKENLYNILNREQYYINILNPEYNICKFAGNRLGVKHEEITKKKIGEASLGRKHNEITKKKISEANLGRKLSEQTKIKMSNSKKGKVSPEKF